MVGDRMEQVRLYHTVTNGSNTVRTEAVSPHAWPIIITEYTVDA